MSKISGSRNRDVGLSGVRKGNLGCLASKLFSLNVPLCPVVSTLITYIVCRKVAELGTYLTSGEYSLLETDLITRNKVRCKYIIHGFFLPLKM